MGQHHSHPPLSTAVACAEKDAHAEVLARLRGYDDNMRRGETSRYSPLQLLTTELSPEQLDDPSLMEKIGTPGMTAELWLTEKSAYRSKGKDFYLQVFDLCHSGVWYAACSEYPCCRCGFINMSDEMNDDEDVVLRAVISGKRHLEKKVMSRASERLRKNKSFFLVVLKQDVTQFALASDSLKNDADFVLAAVKKDGHLLRHASRRLRGNEECVKTAVTTTPEALKYALEGLNQSPACLAAAGIWKARTGPQGIFSVKFSLGQDGPTSTYATTVGLKLASHCDLGKLKMYFQSPLWTVSCDPYFTNLQWPCRGTVETCSVVNADSNGGPTNSSCWRYNFRQHQRICRQSGGFMIQVQEGSGLGKGQELETDMAQLESLKIFRVIQGTEEFIFDRSYWKSGRKIKEKDKPGDRLRDFNEEDADKVSTAVHNWLQSEQKLLAMETIELPHYKIDCT